MDLSLPRKKKKGSREREEDACRVYHVATAAEVLSCLLQTGQIVFCDV